MLSPLLTSKKTTNVVDLTSDLFAHYLLNNNAHEYINGHHGTDYDVMYENEMCHFPGGDTSKIDDTGLNPHDYAATELMLSLWVSYKDRSDMNVLISKWLDSSDLNVWEIEIGADGKITIINEYVNGYYVWLDNGFFLDIDRLYHIIFEISSTTGLKVYVDDNLVNEDLSTNYLRGSYETPQNIGFGRPYTSSPTRNLRGTLSNVRFYSKTKDSVFRTALYNEGPYPAPLPLPSVNNLLAYYPLTGTVDDVTGNNNGTENGVIYTKDAEFGAVADSNPTNAFITLPMTDFTHLDNLSISLWFNIQDLNSPKYLLSKRDSGNDFELSINTDGTVGFIAWGLTNTTIQTPSSVVINKWHKILFTYDGSVMTLTLDETLPISVTSSGIINNTSNLIRLMDNWYNGFSNGLIRHVRIYNAALTQLENNVLYNYEKNFRHIRMSDNLITYYPLINNGFDNWYNELDAVIDTVTFNGVNAAITGSITFPPAPGFVEMYYTLDGVKTYSTIEVNTFTSGTLSNVRKYSKNLTNKEREVIGYPNEIIQ